MVYWLIGMSGAGKSTIGRELCQQIKEKCPNTVLIDGDEIRDIFKHDEGHGDYSVAERKKSSDRLCEMCCWLDRQGINVVCCALSIFEESRQWNRDYLSSYYEVYVKTDVNFLQNERDYKGIYAAAQSGEMKNVVGVDIPFPEPVSPDYIIDGLKVQLTDISDIASKIIYDSRLYND